MFIILTVLAIISISAIVMLIFYKDGRYGLLDEGMLLFIAFMAGFAFVLILPKVLISRAEVSVINKEYGTSYTADDWLMASDKIEEFLKDKKKGE